MCGSPQPHCSAAKPPTEPQLTRTLICALVVNWLAKSCATALNAAVIALAVASEVIELSKEGLITSAAAGCAMLAASNATAAKPQRRATHFRVMSLLTET